MIERQRQARSELVVLAVVIVALSRLAGDESAWLVGGLLLALMIVGSLQVFGETAPDGVPIESLITPSVAAIASLGFLRLVPVGLLAIPALAGAAVLVDGSLRLEIRILGRAKGPTESERTFLLAIALLSAFLSFTGVAALVPDGLAEPVSGGVRAPLGEGSIVMLAAADAFVAFLLGYRFAALRVSRLREATSAALGYAAAIAIAAGLVRAAALPRLLGPALLTLVFFLWDAFRGTEPAARRDPRFVWQMALLGVLGVVVVVWNLMLRP